MAIKNTLVPIVILFIFLSACASDVDSGIFEIVVKEKSEESISIEVKNISNKPVSYEISVERQTPDEWLSVKYSLSCPCRSVCSAIAAPVLDKGQSIMANWDYLDNSCSKAVPGTYRFASYGNVLLGVSNIFTIE